MDKRKTRRRKQTTEERLLAYADEINRYLRRARQSLPSWRRIGHVQIEMKKLLPHGNTRNADGSRAEGLEAWRKRHYPTLSKTQAKRCRDLRRGWKYVRPYYKRDLDLDMTNALRIIARDRPPKARRVNEAAFVALRAEEFDTRQLRHDKPPVPTDFGQARKDLKLVFDNWLKDADPHLLIYLAEQDHYHAGQELLAALNGVSTRLTPQARCIVSLHTKRCAELENLRQQNLPPDELQQRRQSIRERYCYLLQQALRPCLSQGEVDELVEQFQKTVVLDSEDDDDVEQEDIEQEVEREDVKQDDVED